MAAFESYVNSALTDLAEFLGVEVYTLIIGFVVLALIILILILVAVRRKESPIVITASKGGLEDDIDYVERTLAEFDAEVIRIETTKNKLVIKLIEPKPKETKEEKEKSESEKE
jgi:hypothetical protein